jgi:hypothetical protein
MVPSEPLVAVTPTSETMAPAMGRPVLASPIVNFWVELLRQGSGQPSRKSGRRWVSRATFAFMFPQSFGPSAKPTVARYPAELADFLDEEMRVRVSR